VSLYEYTHCQILCSYVRILGEQTLLYRPNKGVSEFAGVIDVILAGVFEKKLY
jgi:hypothetical protein